MKIKKLSQNQRGHIVLVALVVVVVATCAGALLYRNQARTAAIAKERAQYSQAEKDLDALSAQIAAKFGKPDDQKKTKTCGYTSSFDEVSRGDLYCTEALRMSYSVDAKEAAIIRTKEIADSLNTSPQFRFSTLSNGLANVTATPTQLARQSMQDRSGLFCDSEYVFFRESDGPTIGMYLSKLSSGLQITLSCGSRPAKAAYYPISGS